MQIKEIYTEFQNAVKKLQEIEKGLMDLIANEGGAVIMDTFLDWQNQRECCNKKYLLFVESLLTNKKNKVRTSIDLHLEFTQKTGISFSNQIPLLQKRVETDNPDFSLISVHRQYIAFLESKILNT